MDPVTIAAVVAFSLAGSLMGTFSGMVPGIHVNTLAALMAATFPAMASGLSGFLPDGTVTVAVCCCMMAAGVVHSFVDFVPSVFLGAPDSEDAVSVMPGHRLLLEGRGMDAVRAAAIGSLVGCSAAVLLSIPLHYAMSGSMGAVVENVTPYVLAVAAFVLVSSEFRKGVRTGLFGLAAFLVSGCLGYACMTLPIPCTGVLGEGSVLFPLLTGLFGFPVMLSSARGKGRMPKQSEGREDPVGPVPGLAGVVTGCIAGWFPGITSTVGASMAACVLSESRPERYIATVASIGTVTSVLALVTLSVSGSGRTGVALAIADVAGDAVSGMSETFLLLLLATAVASLAGYYLTIRAGSLMSAMVSRVDVRNLNRAVIGLVSALILLLTGPFGLAVALFSTVVGFLPDAGGVNRVVLCGSLLLPVMMFSLRSLELRLGLGHELGVVHDEPLVLPGADGPAGVGDLHRED
jgi:putative membrane protein